MAQIACAQRLSAALSVSIRGMESVSPLQDLANGLQGFGHPLRIRALVLLERTELTPSEMADVLGKPLALVSYHVRALRDHGLVEEVRTESRRGALAHFYRRTELAERLIARLNGELAVPNAGRSGRSRRREQLAEWAATAA